MEIKPPLILKTIFLAGTIDNGNSEDWQKIFIQKMEHIKKPIHSLVYVNPRRDDWDSTWNNDSPEMRNQISWELDHLGRCDSIIMFIGKDSKSPISLLEFGLYADSGKLFVCCEPGFYREANIKVTANMYGITVYDSLDKLINSVYLYSICK